MTFKEFEPYLSAISVVFSVATLGFLLNVTKLIRENANELLAIKDERLKGVVDDHTRLKEWSEREKSELKSKLEDAKSQVDALLKQAGIDPSTLVAGKRLSDAAAGLQETVHRLTAGMQDTVFKLAEIGGRVSASTELGATRTIAMVEMASGRYRDAASQYDAFAASGAATWEDHFSRGVAHANARQGQQSDLAALLAYNDAIALAPNDLEKNQRARLFTYRSAMLKRLGRLTEAENDLSISIRLATAKYERLDAHYNLACIYAMQGRAEEMYTQLAELKGDVAFLSSVASHLHDFFENYRTEPQLQALLR